MIDVVTLCGTPAEVREQVRRYDDLIGFVMLYPPSFPLPKEDVLANRERMIAAFARP